MSGGRWSHSVVLRPRSEPANSLEGIGDRVTVRVERDRIRRTDHLVTGERFKWSDWIVDNYGLGLSTKQTDLQRIAEVSGFLALRVGLVAIEPGTGFSVLTEPMMGQGAEKPIVKSLFGDGRASDLRRCSSRP
jgi:hypothetical protein